MGVQVAGRSSPGNVASGSWNVTALNSGRLRFSFTFTQSSASGAYPGYKAFYANGDGGIYLVSGVFNIFNNAAGGTAIYGQTITWAAGATVNFDIDQVGQTVTISGALTGNVTNQGFSRGATPIFTSGLPLGVMQFTDAGYSFAGLGTISDLDDGLAAGASGSASSGGITGSGTAITGKLASGSASVAGITSSGSASVPGAASGTSAVAGITGAGTAASPALASGSTDVGGVSSSGAATGVVSLFGTIGSATAAQRADVTGSPTGTLSTSYVARTPSAVVAVNDRLAFNGRRWFVNTAGTLGAGSGPTGSGAQADGTATLVAMTSTDTALAMTTQAVNSVMLAVLMRENWSSDTSAPTDSKGNTYALQGTAHAYGGFPSASSALFTKTNAAGGSNHTLSATWPAKGGVGAEMSMLAVEVPTGRSTSIVQAVSFVERANASSVVSASITTTGPAMLVAFWLGTGNVLSVGTTHPGAPQSPMIAIPNADTAVAIHNNGYIQGKSAYAYVTTPGTYTATWTGTSEGAQLYLVAIQEAPGTVASGAASVGGISSAGVAGPAALGTAASGGVSSTGVAGSVASSSTATGGGASGGVFSSGNTAVVAVGATFVGGVSGVGAAITGKLAGGAAAVGGVTSAGTVVVPGASSGTSIVGGIAGAGVASSGTLAGGAALVGGISSLGIAQSAGPVSTPFGALVDALDRAVLEHLG